MSWYHLYNVFAKFIFFPFCLLFCLLVKSLLLRNLFVFDRKVNAMQMIWSDRKTRKTCFPSLPKPLSTSRSSLIFHLDLQLIHVIVLSHFHKYSKYLQLFLLLVKDRFSVVKITIWRVCKRIWPNNLWPADSRIDTL